MLRLFIIAALFRNILNKKSNAFMIHISVKSFSMANICAINKAINK